MAAHAVLGASGSHRWMVCPGSIRLSEGAPNGSSPQAIVGTVAHTLGENALAVVQQNRDPYFGDWADYLENAVGWAVDPDYPDVIVDRDMVDAVKQYARLTVPMIQSDPNMAHIELQVSLKGYGRTKQGRAIALEMFGTADFVFVDLATGALHIMDYKHGAGITVEPADNPQLKYYAAGVLANLAETAPEILYAIETVISTVVQPRDDHLIPIRHYCYTVEEIEDWVEDDLLPAALATQEPDAPLVAGDHCRFCPAQARCPERRTQQMEKAKMKFSDTEDCFIPEKSTQELSIAELRALLDSAEDIIAYVKSAQKYAHESLEQNSLSAEDAGELGYKLVKKRAMRKFKGGDEQVADALCEEFGLGDDELFTKKLRSPAQIEKEIGTARAKKSDTWNGLIVSESSGTTLARDDDNRPAVKVATAKDKFSKVEDEEDEEESLV